MLFVVIPIFVVNALIVASAVFEKNFRGNVRIRFVFIAVFISTIRPQNDVAVLSFRNHRTRRIRFFSNRVLFAVIKKRVESALILVVNRNDDNGNLERIHIKKGHFCFLSIEHRFPSIVMFVGVAIFAARRIPGGVRGIQFIFLSAERKIILQPGIFLAVVEGGTQRNANRIVSFGGHVILRNAPIIQTVANRIRHARNDISFSVHCEI